MVERVEYLTAEGRARLEQRLTYLKEVRRPEVAERLHQAIQDGGELTENTEFEEAKNEQAMLEADIARITHILTTAKLIQEGTQQDEVQLGSRITLTEKGTQNEETYWLVGSAEANPRQGKISIESPVGRALLGKKIGDKVKINAPDGEITFVVQQIS